MGEFPHIFFGALPVTHDDLLDPISDHVAALGFELVDLQRAGTRDRPVLKLRVDRPDSRPGHGVTTEDCAAVSRSLESLLESRGLVGPRYVLEVSSPGVERPLTRPSHWRRFTGELVRVRSAALEGRPTVTIAGVPDDEHVVVRLEDGSERTLELAAIREANLAIDWSRLGRRKT